MDDVMDLKESIRRLVQGKIKCGNCGNEDWEQFLYVGELPNGGMAGCKLCAHVTTLDEIIRQSWQPSKSDLSWTRALISLWADQAVWKTSFAIFRADCTEKTLTVAEILRPDIIDRELAKIRATFSALGWEVVRP